MLAVADSGCQACLMGLAQLYKMGLQKSDLCRILSASVERPCMIILRLAGVDPASGKIVETAAQVRVAEGVKDLFISKNVMKALGILPADFPRIMVASTGETTTVDDYGEETCPGDCKLRGPPPPIPPELPFAPTEKNVPDMKAWIRGVYFDSGAICWPPHLKKKLIFLLLFWTFQVISKLFF